MGRESKSVWHRVLANAHESVISASDHMLKQWRRHIYVTPTSYLELVKSYREMLASKRKEVGKARDRLKNGTTKLDEAKVQVEEMSVSLERKKLWSQKHRKTARSSLL